MLRTLVGLVLLAGASAGGLVLRDWALVTPQFALQSVNFRGLSRATDAELMRLSGFSSGQNLWKLDPELMARGMASHPWVRHVEVTRRFPRSVRVAVEEHSPEAMAVLSDLYLVNAHGEPFKKVGPEDALDLPLFTGISRDTYMKNPEAGATRFRDALDVAHTYETSPAAKGAGLSEVHLESDGVSLITGAGQEVRLGIGALPEKLQRLVRVREELARRNVVATTVRLDDRSRPGWVTVALGRSAVEKSQISKNAQAHAP